MIKVTGVKLDLISDINMYQFIGKSLRGGVSYIARKYSKASNEYMNSYGKNESSKHIIYLGANNMYRWAMAQYLPTGELKWLTQDEIKKLDVGTIREENTDGCILEVDLEYSKELHNLNND